jgi:hypothetical protein
VDVFFGVSAQVTRAMLVAKTVSIADMEAPADLAANENDTAEKHSGSSLELIWKVCKRKEVEPCHVLQPTLI